jgi:preprotein translocase subunit YajC
VHTSLMLLHHVLAAGTTTTTKKKGGFPTSIFFLIAIFAVVYFIFLRPQRNKQRAAAVARRQVEVGDEVTTTAGLIATVVAVEDDFLTLEVAPGVNCRYVPAAVLRVNGPDEESEEADSEETERDVSTHEVIDEPDGEQPSDTDEHSNDVPTADDHLNVSPAPELTDGTTHGTTETTDNPDEPAPA